MPLPTGGAIGFFGHSSTAETQVDVYVSTSKPLVPLATANESSSGILGPINSLDIIKCSKFFN
jgi:hypothetical protein